MAGKIFLMIIGNDYDIVYGPTPEGHWLNDLAFTNLSAKVSLPANMSIPVIRIWRMRHGTEIKKLRKQNRTREKGQMMEHADP